jgi:capsular exopolysaccharide synthesis family protein
MSAAHENQPEHTENTCALPQIQLEEVNIPAECRAVVQTEVTGPAADRFRLVKLRLDALSQRRGLKTLLVTSPLPGDGKSTMALNLATALADRGKRPILLVEADLHRQSLTQLLRIESGPGLAECLECGVHPLAAVRRLEPLGWFLLPRGTPRSSPTELLHSEVLSGILQELAGYFNWILVDSPPVIPLTDAISLARHTDASVLVARVGRTPREAIEQTVKLLGPEHVLGILLNGVEGLNRKYAGYYGVYPSSDLPPGGPSKEEQNESAPSQWRRPKHPSTKSHRHLL